MALPSYLLVLYDPSWKTSLYLGVYICIYQRYTLKHRQWNSIDKVYQKLHNHWINLSIVFCTKNLLKSRCVKNHFDKRCGYNHWNYLYYNCNTLSSMNSSPIFFTEITFQAPHYMTRKKLLRNFYSRTILYNPLLSICLKILE